MKKIMLLLFTLLLLIVLTESVRMAILYHVSRGLITRAVPYEQQGASSTQIDLLVLGDSTGAGVGAHSPRASVAGYVGVAKPQWTIENHAVSGAKIADMAGQLAQAKQEHYPMILLQVGGNDIIAMHSAEASRAAIDPLLKELATRADKVVFISAGNVGAAYFFPWFLRPHYRQLTIAHHAMFAEESAKYGVQYVNLYIPPEADPFVLERNVYLAGDGVHPSSRGYNLWFQKITPFL